MRTIGLIFKRNNAAASRAACRVVDWLSQRGAETLLTPGQQRSIGKGVPVDEPELGGRAEFLVTLGGDGTLLHAAGALRERAVPILGVNMGRLGFLTPFSEEELDEALAEAFEGRLEVQRRMRLQVRLRRTGNEELAGIATNDAVISQGAMARLLELEVRQNEQLITTYRADGLIVSTPTGSTAYNLSAGGPLLTPGLAAICVTPICPHTLTNRSLVLPADCVISAQVVDTGDRPYLTIDGQQGYILNADDQVMIARAQESLLLFQAPSVDIFELLRSKLSWGGSAG